MSTCSRRPGDSRGSHTTAAPQVRLRAGAPPRRMASSHTFAGTRAGVDAAVAVPDAPRANLAPPAALPRPAAVPSVDFLFTTEAFVAGLAAALSNTAMPVLVQDCLSALSDVRINSSHRPGAVSTASNRTAPRASNGTGGFLNSTLSASAVQRMCRSEMYGAEWACMGYATPAVCGEEKEGG